MIENYRQWCQFIQTLRTFFLQQGYLEVQTPRLVPCPGTEPTLDVFSTEFQMGRRRQKFYLPTSPELHAKKLICRGLTHIFDLGPCFRNGEISEKHQPEFTMLEWYEVGGSLKSLQAMIEKLLAYLQGGQPQSIPVVTMAELFQQHFQFDLTPQTSFQQLLQLCHASAVETHSSDSWDDLFYRLYLGRIEPSFQKYPALFVTDYPPSQAALARCNDQGWAQRFEFFIHGIEIANAFDELTDPLIQKDRFEKDLEEKLRLGKEAIPLDTEFLQDLQKGMPPTAGIALGVERLFMALHNYNSIRDFKYFTME